jgi:hypothetical protein
VGPGLMVFSDLFNFKDLTSVSIRNFKPCEERWHFMRAIKLKRRKKLKEELKREWVKRYLILNKSSGPKRYVNFSLSLLSLFYLSNTNVFLFFPFFDFCSVGNEFEAYNFCSFRNGETS